ncbi:hypothetical protein AAC387_Pa02g3319 [Persea americana]
MGTGWRKAFCTSTQRVGEPADKQPSPRSNPSTPRLQSQLISSPRLRCRTLDAASPAQDCPRLRCKTSSNKTPRPQNPGSNPSSPKSPSTFALFKTGVRLSKNCCGICFQSTRTGHGLAIYTAECSHAFHFPCIAAQVRKQQGSLSCPVCSASWHDVPLLASHKHQTAAAGEEEKQKRERKSAHDSKVYDDDESLLSPNGSKFNPIPEENEDEEEEVGEFQGFFVDASSSSKGRRTDGPDSKKVEVTLLSDAAVVSAGRSCESYAVALTVRAPAPAQRRAPIDLVTVLNVSGSMAGAKLRMLKRAMRLVVSSLGSADRLSIVAFSATSKRLMPLRRMSEHGQHVARAIVDRLVCGHGTCEGDALKKAAKVLEDRRERNPVASIILLSDGQNNRDASHGADRSRPYSHVPSSTRFTHLEIPVHESGFGSRASRKSREPVAKCVGGLLSVVAQDVRLDLTFPSGEISAVYSTIGRLAILGSGTVRLGDIYADEERELLVELRVPTSAAWAHHVISVRCSYVDPTTTDLVRCKEQTLLVPRPHAVPPSDPKIQRLRNQFVATKAAAEARRLAEHNDFGSAHQLLSSARALLLQSSSISRNEDLRFVEAELAELQWRWKQQQIQRPRIGDLGLEESGPLTPSSAWRAAEQLAKVAIMRKSLNRVGDLHGFENARF